MAIAEEEGSQHIAIRSAVRSQLLPNLGNAVKIWAQFCYSDPELSPKAAAYEEQTLF